MIKKEFVLLKNILGRCKIRLLYPKRGREKKMK